MKSSKSPQINKTCIRKIILLLPKCSENVHVTLHLTQKHKDRPLTTIPDLGQAHETCGGVKLV